MDVDNDWPVTVSAAGNVIPRCDLDAGEPADWRGYSDDPVKLANFWNKGGKVIMYHGGSDSLTLPFQWIWFYEELALLQGGYRHTQHSVRLFIVPDMGQCGGGVADCRRSGRNQFGAVWRFRLQSRRR